MSKRKEQVVTVQWAHDKALLETHELTYKGVLVSAITPAGLALFDVEAGLTYRRLPGNTPITVKSKKGKKPAKYKNKLAWAYEGEPDVMHRSKQAAATWADSGVLRLGLGKLLKFDSLAECHYWQHLKRLEATGIIRDLKTQTSFELYPRFEWDGKQYNRVYRVDFDYVEVVTLTRVVADVKGFETDLFKLKMELFILANWQELTTGRMRFELIDSKKWG